MLGKRVSELAKLQGKASKNESEIRGFATDSRKVVPGDLFFALRGETFDGHHFLSEAKERGAVAAVVDRAVSEAGLDTLFVDDVLRFLHTLAKIRVSEGKARRVAVTGSSGKTTVKEFLCHLLEESFVVGKTPGNENSQVGVPLSILRQEESEIFVAEMGMSRKGEIASLVDLFPPEIAIVTSIAPAHAAFFPRGVEEIAEAKAEILQNPGLQHAFISAEACSFPAISRELLCKRTTYGKGGDIEAIAQEDGSYRIRFREGDSEPFFLPFSAKHLIDNFVVAAAVAKDLGVEEEIIVSRAKTLRPYSMRFETTVRNGITYVNDAYNANPGSMRAALENLPRPGNGGRVIAALGCMGELGNFAETLHLELGAKAGLHADLLFCIGEYSDRMESEFRKSGKPAFRFTDWQELRNALRETAREGDVVLVKASNSAKLWRVLEE